MLRTALRAWYARRLVDLRSRRRPRDSAAIRSGDPRADRVLVVGNGFTAGWGVNSHHTALSGRLSEALSDRTGRGCDLDVVGAESMNMRAARAWLGDRDLESVDAVVIAVGLSDALCRTPLDEWERGLRDLLAAVVARIADGAPTLVVGIPPVDALPAFDGFVARLAATHRDRLNAVSRLLAAEYGVDYVDLPEFTHSRRGHLTVRSVYRQLGAKIARELALRLVAYRPTPDPREPQGERTWQWSATDAVVAHAAWGGLPTLRRLTESAQRILKVEIAAVGLVDGDRVYYATNTDLLAPSVPVELSFCRHPVATGEPVVVPDARADARFTDNPLTATSAMRFYAGYPLRASDGTVVGCFCLQGSRPRSDHGASMEVLRGLAQQVEAELQRLERAQPLAPAADGFELRRAS